MGDGYREWTDPRVGLLSGSRTRGHRASSRDTFSAARERWCRWHTQTNVLAALPKSSCDGARPHSVRSTASEISTRPAPTSKRSSSIMAPFIGRIVDDKDVLMECHGCPAAHCIHLPASNPGLRNAEIAIIVYQPKGSAQARGRTINAAHLVVPVGVGETVRTGKLLERPVGITPAAPTESTRNGGRPKQPQPQILTKNPAMPRQSRLAVPTHLQLAKTAALTAAGRMAQVTAVI